MEQGTGRIMIKSPTRSLAQLLASTGHDDDDIFVARAINPVRGGTAADQGWSDQGQGKPGTIRLEGGFDYHKFNMKMALLKGPAKADPDDNATMSDADAADGADGDSGNGGPTGGTDTSTVDPASPDTGDTDISPDNPDTGGTGTSPDSPDTDNTDSGDTDATGDDEDDTNPGPDVDPGPDPDTTVIGSMDDDILSGGDGVDTFVFEPDGGDDIIANFDVGTDILDLRAYGFASIDEVLSHAVSDDGGLTLAIGNGTIVLSDVTFAQAADLSILFV
jgi:hypothetical protein